LRGPTSKGGEEKRGGDEREGRKRGAEGGEQRERRPFW